MSEPLLWLMLIGLALATFSAIAFHVIKEMPWHEMEDYCLLFPTEGVGFTLSRLLTVAGLMAFALVVTQVWVPRAVAKIAAPAFLYRTWRWWKVVSLVGFPFFVGERFVSEMFARASGQEEDEDAEEEAVEDEILSLASEAQHDGLLESQTVDMIEGIMDLDDFTVVKVMKPRSGVDAMDVSTDWEEMLTFVVKSGRTRIPIFDGKIDNIVGILFAKDLLRESLKKPNKRRSLEKLIRPPMTVLATTQLDTMLREFLDGRMHMAIVRDEYGGLAGVVTIEDVLEEIVGEIVDETDAEEEVLIRKCGKQTIEVAGRAPIDMVNEELATQLPEVDDFATVAGLLMWELKQLPRPGQQLVFENVRFEVKEVNRREIRRVRIEVLDVDGAES